MVTPKEQVGIITTYVSSGSQSDHVYESNVDEVSEVKALDLFEPNSGTKKKGKEQK